MSEKVPLARPVASTSEYATFAGDRVLDVHRVVELAGLSPEDAVLFVAQPSQRLIDEASRLPRVACQPQSMALWTVPLSVGAGVGVPGIVFAATGAPVVGLPMIAAGVGVSVLATWAVGMQFATFARNLQEALQKQYFVATGHKIVKIDDSAPRFCCYCLPIGETPRSVKTVEYDRITDITLQQGGTCLCACLVPIPQLAIETASNNMVGAGNQMRRVPEMTFLAYEELEEMRGIINRASSELRRPHGAGPSAGMPSVAPQMGSAAVMKRIFVLYGEKKIVVSAHSLASLQEAAAGKLGLTSPGALQFKLAKHGVDVSDWEELGADDELTATYTKEV